VLAFEQEQHRICNLLLGYDNNRIHNVANSRKREIPGFGNAYPVRDRPPGADRCRPALPQALFCRWTGCGLHTHDRYFRPQGLCRGCDPGDEPAAPDRDHDEVGLRQVGEDLKANRPLPGNDLPVIEGMDEEPALRSKTLCPVNALFERSAVEDHLCPVPPGCLLLGDRRPLGHHDDGRDTGGMSGDDHALGMVSRRCRNHPHTFDRITCCKDLV